MPFTQITDYGIGTQVGWTPAAVYVPSTTSVLLPRPKSIGIQYAEQRFGGNGGRYDVGKPFIDWEWNFLLRDEYNSWITALYLGSGSRSVKIVVNAFDLSLSSSTLWVWYKAWVDVPNPPKRTLLGVENVVIRFRQLTPGP